MWRILKWLAGGVAAAIAIPVLLILLVMNIGPGRRLVEALTPRITHGAVRIEDIEGWFPSALRVHRVVIADAAGVWLTVDDAALDWSPTRLVSGEVSIDRLEARNVSLDRLPQASGGGGTALPPFRVALAHL